MQGGKVNYVIFSVTQRAAMWRLAASWHRYAGVTWYRGEIVIGRLRDGSRCRIYLVMARYNEPNASHYSARYAERKRAAERARDMQPRKPEPCKRPGCQMLQAPGSLHCANCTAEYHKACENLSLTSDVDAHLKAWGLK